MTANVFNPSFKDLLHLRSVLSKDQSSHTSYLLPMIEKELARVPSGAEVSCLMNRRRGQSKDIFYLGEHETHVRLRQAVTDGRIVGPESILIICPNKLVARAVFESSILSELDVKNYGTSPYVHVTLGSGQRIDVISEPDTRNATCGKSYDLAIVYTGAD